MTMNKPKKLREDGWLSPYMKELRERHRYIEGRRHAIMDKMVAWHEQFGLHRVRGGWRFREWLPNATAVWLVGSFNDWAQTDSNRLVRGENGVWEGHFPAELLHHGDAYGLWVEWEGGSGYRLPSCATRVVRAKEAYSQYGIVFNAQVWHPRRQYVWKHESPRHAAPIIYEAHVGMGTEEERVGTFAEFTRDILPRIAAGGYNTVQLMAIQEHPFYGSFGYHVSNLYAVCDLFGTPEDFKQLVDTAHGLGLRVVMDLVHSHAVKNETEGLGCQDGTEWLYFHAGARGHHPAWDSRCFDYGKDEVCRLLLSNCKFWLEEYHVDGFRFDGVTSMMYLDHGLGKVFTGYGDYFTMNTDWDALAYLAMANCLIHEIRPDAWTLAEDVSGMPGLGARYRDLGYGFDFRLAMGVTDCWMKLAADVKDEDWSMFYLWHELTNHRQDERSVSYVECHDQALVGGKTFIFTLIDKEMYYSMHRTSGNLLVERGVALHKMARLLTLGTASDGYLNFMGNEFGHPEWIDFPRQDNGWSYAHARRQWSLRDNPQLYFKPLGDFDVAMLKLVRETTDFYGHVPQSLRIDEERKLIAFERDGLYFFFNFHPTASQPELRVKVLPGRYAPVLDTDAEIYGGHGLIGSGWSTVAEQEVDEENCCENWWLQVNLPARTGLVLRRQS